MTVEQPDLPASLRPSTGFPFVGRTAELEKLTALLPRSAADGRRVALLAGEPGAGKSRLVREFAAAAAEAGALVLYGACDPAVSTPYGPFVEALERLVAVVPAGRLEAALGPEGGELTRLLPALASAVDSLPPPVAGDPDAERHRLHSALATLLANVSRERPLLLIVEDGHWADASTLLALRHLARSAWGARALVVVTFRDTEADLPPQLADALADLRRSEGVARVRLPALAEPDVAALIRRAAGVGAAPDPGLERLAATVHDLTGGNAFLVCELWRDLVETGAVSVAGGRLQATRQPRQLGTPESVREVVSQRLSRLGPGTIDLLELAAVAGPEFELEPIRRGCGLAEPEFLAAIEEAVASGMIEEAPGRLLSFRFSHELVRRALYDRLSRLRRAELHLRVGEAIEAGGRVGDRSLADLAHHFGAASQLGGAERAVDYNLRAAEAAASALAFDEAAARLRTAIEIGIEDDSRRAEALLRLGAVYHRAGHATEAIGALAAAAAIARETGDTGLLARAAIGYEEACWRPGLIGDEAVELLEEGLAAVAEEETALRIGLLAGLGRALDFRGDVDRGQIVRENAIALARVHEDGAGLAKLLVRSYWARGTASPEEVLAMLTEARLLAAALGDTETETEATAWRVPTFVTLCDLSSARAEAAALAEMAERTAQPFMNHVAQHYGSAIALCEGDLGRAEALAERSQEWGQMLTGRDAAGTYGIQMFGLRREQGRLAELAPAIRILAAEADRVGPWQPGLIAVLAELGMEREARQELGRLAAEGLDRFRPSLWLAALAYLTDASAALGDEATAAILYPELAPLAGGNVMIGHLVACYGAADRYLGMLAATLGESQLAEEHFERALELNRRMGAATWLAHTQYEYGRFLLRGGSGGRDRGAELLGEATALAERIGLGSLLARARSLGVAAPAPELPGGLSPREAQILALVARGLSNREIGGELSISEHTAANHVRAILRKTDSANRTEAASFAHRHGLIPAS